MLSRVNRRDERRSSASTLPRGGSETVIDFRFSSSQIDSPGFEKNPNNTRLGRKTERFHGGHGIHGVSTKLLTKIARNVSAEIIHFTQSIRCYKKSKMFKNILVNKTSVQNYLSVFEREVTEITYDRIKIVT